MRGRPPSRSSSGSTLTLLPKLGEGSGSGHSHGQMGGSVRGTLVGGAMAVHGSVAGRGSGSSVSSGGDAGGSAGGSSGPWADLVAGCTNKYVWYLGAVKFVKDIAGFGISEFVHTICCRIFSVPLDLSGCVVYCLCGFHLQGEPLPLFRPPHSLLDANCGSEHCFWHNHEHGGGS